MMAYLLAFSHIFDQFVRQILWMGSHEPDPFKAWNSFYHLKKLRKGYRMLQGFAIGIYILSKKHHLCHPICYQRLHFIYDRLRLSAALPSTYIRNNTVAAEIIAAEHNIYPGFERVITLCRQFFHDLFCTFPNFHQLAVPVFHLIEQLCKPENIVGSKYKIYKWIILPDLIYYMLFLHHAAK